MSQITENDIERWAIEVFKALGSKYIHGTIIAPDGDALDRMMSYQEVVCKFIKYFNNTFNVCHYNFVYK